MRLHIYSMHWWNCYLLGCSVSSFSIRAQLFMSGRAILAETLYGTTPGHLLQASPCNFSCFICLLYISLMPHFFMYSDQVCPFHTSVISVNHLVHSLRPWHFFNCPQLSRVQLNSLRAQQMPAIVVYRFLLLQLLSVHPKILSSMLLGVAGFVAVDCLSHAISCCCCCCKLQL